jgi:glycosyltransferase involved in cell wall biosynthesis
LKKIISIVIATYNAEKNIYKCLTSIENSITNQCELILIDGNSKDETINEIKRKEKIVDILVSEPDLGIYDAWNKGIKLSSGDWIMFMGSDDLLFENSLSIYLNFLKKNDVQKCDYICAQNQYLNFENKLIKKIGKEPSWSRMKYYMPAAHVASLHNRKLFDEVGYYDLKFKICADYELLCRKKYNLNYRFIKHEIAQMKTGGISFSTKALIEQFNIRKKHLNIVINFFVFSFQIFLFFRFKFFHKTDG